MCQSLQSVGDRKNRGLGYQWISGVHKTNGAPVQILLWSVDYLKMYRPVRESRLELPVEAWSILLFFVLSDRHPIYGSGKLWRSVITVSSGDYFAQG